MTFAAVPSEGAAKAAEVSSIVTMENSVMKMLRCCIAISPLLRCQTLAKSSLAYASS
jgi:hypothetical protein